MFTSAKIRSGSTYLVSHLSANDYYAKGERVTGEWVGEGAGSLGLSGEVRPEDPCLLVRLLSQTATTDPPGKPEVVTDQRTGGCLASDPPFIDDQGAESF